MERNLISSNVAIGVTLLGLKVNEDNDRIYLSGSWITNNSKYLYIRDEALTFHKDWNHLIDAIKEFKDFKKIYNKYNFSHFSEFSKYFEFVGKINEGLTSISLEYTHKSLVEAIDWLINLRN